MTNTTHLGITLVEQSQAQKEVTVNQALTRIDAVLNSGAKSRVLNAPPGSPASGDLYIVGSSPTGAWSGQAGNLAYFDQIWRFIPPNEGMSLWVNDEDVTYSYNGVIWRPLAISSSFVNKFRNSTFDVWQRGISGTITAGTPAHSADGWVISSSGANVTWQQLAGRALSAYCLKITGNTSVTNTFIRQRVESFLCYQLAGQQVTVQAQIYNNTGATITPTITVKHAGSTDNWSSPVTDVNTQNLQSCANATWTQIYYTFTAHSASGNGLEVTIDFAGTLNSNTKSVQVCEADMRLSSSIAIPDMRPLHTELAFCQRYLPAYVFNASSAFTFLGQCYATTTAYVIFPFAYPSRIAPTGVSVSANGHFQLTNAGGTGVNITAASFHSATPLNAAVSFSVASGLVAGNATLLSVINTAGSIYFTGAEL